MESVFKRGFLLKNHQAQADQQKHDKELNDNRSVQHAINATKETSEKELKNEEKDIENISDERVLDKVNKKKEKKKKATSFSHLPPEVVLQIFSFLDPLSIKAVASISR